MRSSVDLPQPDGPKTPKPHHLHHHSILYNYLLQMEREGDTEHPKADEDYDIDDLKNENDYGDECEDGPLKSNRG